MGSSATRHESATLPEDPLRTAYWIFGGVVLASLLGGAATGWYWLAGVPLLLLLVYQSIVNFRAVFYLLLFCLPLSTEVYLPNGLGTDLPTEPLMVGLLLVYLLFLFHRGGAALSAAFLRHPLTLLLLLHLGWTLLTTLFSDLLYVSVKFSLAKIWYVGVFYFLTAYLIRQPEQLRTFFWVVFWPLLATVVIIFTRHALEGFSFMAIHGIMQPFQRNHVNYAAIIALFLPYVVLVLSWRRRYSGGWWLLLGTVLFLLVATYFSYTRAAYISLVLAAGAYWVIRWRLTRLALLVASVGVIGFTAYNISDNRYLELAPNYETTVAHTQFDNLVEATYRMEDISTMERLYRWVAGAHMAPSRPWVGWGPGNFVNFYRPYTVTSFRTYVSENKEKSGVHSYYLMLLVEQGLIGLLLFVGFLFGIFIYGERAYHRMGDPMRRGIIMATLLSTVVIASFLIINDLIETDKVGSFFFMNIAILINFSLPRSAGHSP